MPMLVEALFTFGIVLAISSDLQQRRIPNALNLAILVAGFGARAVLGGTAGLSDAALGAGLGLVLLVVPFAARWIGAGDVKLVVALGAWLGPANIFWATLGGIAGGGLVALVMIARAGLGAEVRGTLTASLATLRAPSAPRRARHLLVPMALPLGLAALVVAMRAGGIHV